MILCRSGRGIAEIIRHLMHLTPTGWCIFIGIVASAILLTFFSRKILGRVMVAKARIQYPEFQWVAMPKIGGKLSVIIFCILFSFLGYFSSIAEDISFFRFFGLFCAALYAFMSFLPANQSCAILCNKSELYIAKYSGFGRFRPIKNLENITVFEEARENEKILRIKHGNSKLKTFGYITPSHFTEGGNLKIQEFLNHPSLTLN